MPLYKKSDILGVIVNNENKFVFIPKITIKPFFNGPTKYSVVYNNWRVNRFSVTNFIPQNLSSKIFNKVLLNFTLLNNWIKPVLRFEEEQTKIKSPKSVE